MKTIQRLALIAVITAALCFVNIPNASAKSFQSSQSVSFTFNPTVSITVSGNLVIESLTPGDYKDSNIITVTASSNTPLGYTLSSTVGSSTNASTELRKDGTDTTNKFTNLSSNKASLDSFDAGTWGYSYSTNSGSTWISGDIIGTTNSGYNGLPLYTTESPIKLINSSSPNESSIQFKIGARAASTQLAGTYTNVVNFIGVGKVVTTNYTINYSDPSGEAASGTIPSTQTGSSTTGAVQISSTGPTRTGYIFKGWCTVSTSDDTCSGDIVQPNGSLALNPGTSSDTATVTKTLYAMWKSTINEEGCMPIIDPDDNEQIGCVPNNKITLVYHDDPNAEAKLGSANYNTFMSYLNEYEQIDYQIVLEVFWLDIPESYKTLLTEENGYARYEFDAIGENVGVLVNNQEVEVVHVENDYYFANITEFGAVAIVADS